MSYKTGVQVTEPVHKELFAKKRRPSESFDVVLRRELGLPAPAEESKSGTAETDGSEGDVAANSAE